MSKYKIKFYKGEYRERQRQASKDKAICYVEHHFNSVASPAPNYSVVVTGSNSSKKTEEFARKYIGLISDTFNTKLGGRDGVLRGGYSGRGNGNVFYAACPSILVEPLFASNPEHADIIKSQSGQASLAKCLVIAIRECFPDGGLVAFSVGHKYKSSKPADRGAPIYSGGTEADYAEKVLLLAAEELADDETGIQAEPDAMPIIFSDDESEQAQVENIPSAIRSDTNPTQTSATPDSQPSQLTGAENLSIQPVQSIASITPVAGGGANDPATKVTTGGPWSRQLAAGGGFTAILAALYGAATSREGLIVIGVLGVFGIVALLFFRQLILDYVRLQLFGDPNKLNVK